MLTTSHLLPAFVPLHLLPQHNHHNLHHTFFLSKSPSTQHEEESAILPCKARYNNHAVAMEGGEPNQRRKDPRMNISFLLEEENSPPATQTSTSTRPPQSPPQHSQQQQQRPLRWVYMRTDTTAVVHPPTPYPQSPATPSDTSSTVPLHVATTTSTTPSTTTLHSPSAGTNDFLRVGDGLVYSRRRSSGDTTNPLSIQALNNNYNTTTTTTTAPTPISNLEDSHNNYHNNEGLKRKREDTNWPDRLASSSSADPNKHESRSPPPYDFTQQRPASPPPAKVCKYSPDSPPQNFYSRYPPFPQYPSNTTLSPTTTTTTQQQQQAPPYLAQLSQLAGERFARNDHEYARVEYGRGYDEDEEEEEDEEDEDEDDEDEREEEEGEEKGRNQMERKNRDGVEQTRNSAAYGDAVRDFAVRTKLNTSPSAELLPPRQRRKRLCNNQVQVLMEHFEINPFPTEETKRQLAEALGLTPKQVQNWFHNKRARLRKRERRAAEQKTIARNK